jgi:hypothetical protein
MKSERQIKSVLRLHEKLVRETKHWEKERHLAIVEILSWVLS